MDTALKMLEPTELGPRVGGYLIIWGSAKNLDLHGEYFTEETELGLNAYDRRPVFYQHGLDATLKADIIGHIDTLRADEIGVWAEAQLEMHKRYVDAVNDLVIRGALHWSSGTLPHLVDVAEDGRIKRWIIVEGSLTPTPAEPRRTDVSVIKAYYKDAGLDTSLFDDGYNSDDNTSEDVAQANSEPTSVPAIQADDNNVKSVQLEKVNPMTDEPTNNSDVPVQQSVEIDYDKLATSMKSLVDAEVSSKMAEFIPDKVGMLKTAGGDVHPVAGATDDDSNGTKAFLEYVRTGDVNSGLKATLVSGTDSLGGYTVPVEMEKRIIAKRSENDLTKLIPNFQTLMTTSDTYDIPIEDAAAVAMDETAEGASSADTSLTLDNRQGVIKDYTRVITLSNRLSSDENVNLEAFLANRIGREQALARNKALVDELVANGTAALTIDSNSAISVPEIDEIIGTQNEEYLAGSVWLMRHGTHRIIKSLQGEGFLFASPSMERINGRPPLDEYPVYYSSYVDAMGASKVPIFFFLPEYVTPIERSGITVLVDPYSDAINRRTRLHYEFRFDVVITQSEAIRKIATPA